MSSTLSNSVSHQAAPILRFFEDAVRQIYRRISQQAVTSLLKTALLFLAVYGLKEVLVRMFGFRCPQHWYFFYGSLYIFGPTIFFLCFAFVFCRPFWEFVTGCCGSRNRIQLLSSPSAALSIYLAISAPFLWVAAALSEEEYYFCAVYGRETNKMKRLRCPGSRYGLSSTAMTQERFAGSAECHLIAWGVIISWAISSAFMVSLYRCLVRDEEQKSFV